MPISSGSHIPYPDFKKCYGPSPGEPVLWRWSEVSRHLDDVEHPERGSLALALPAGSAEVVRDVAVAYQVVPAGRSTTPHAHTWYHLFVVQSGTGTVTFHQGAPGRGHQDAPGREQEGERGDEPSTGLRAGDILLVPAWSTHHFTNSGEHDLVLLNLMNIPLLADLGTLATTQPREAGA